MIVPEDSSCVSFHVFYLFPFGCSAGSFLKLGFLLLFTFSLFTSFLDMGTGSAFYHKMFFLGFKADSIRLLHFYSPFSNDKRPLCKCEISHWLERGTKHSL